MIPTMWHDQPSYGHASYDPIWAACADAGLVVHTHSGEADTPAYNENMAQFMLEVAFWTHRALWQLLLSGTFDRFPNLKYAPVECGSWWLGDLLYKTDVMFGGQNWKVKKMASSTKGLIQRLPSEYVGTNVFIGASAMSKPELRRRYVNGLDALDVGHRLPPPRGHLAQHASSACPPTSARSRSRRPGCSWGSTRCAATTSTSTASAGIAADIGPTPEQLNQDLDLRTPPDAIREARFWFDDYGIEWKD